MCQRMRMEPVLATWGDGNNTCPRSRTCDFFRTVAPSFVLRMKYATMYPYCQGGQHETCVRWWLLENDRPVPHDLMPDGGKDDFGALASPLSPKRILVIDDMPMFTRVMRAHLEAIHPGTEVIESSSANEALGILRSGRAFDLVITDYNMPGMTGEDLIREMRSDAAFTGIPVIVMSTEPNPQRRERCLSYTRVRWIDKKPDREPIEAAFRALVIDRQL